MWHEKKGEMLLNSSASTVEEEEDEDEEEENSDSDSDAEYDKKVNSMMKAQGYGKKVNSSMKEQAKAKLKQGRGRKLNGGPGGKKGLEKVSPASAAGRKSTRSSNVQKGKTPKKVAKADNGEAQFLILIPSIQFCSLCLSEKYKLKWKSSKHWVLKCLVIKLLKKYKYKSSN